MNDHVAPLLTRHHDFDETVLAGKRILIFQQRGWGKRVGHFLAGRLQASGCVLAAFTQKRDTDRFTRRQTDVRYEMVIDGDGIKEDPLAYLQGADISLEDVCRDLNVGSVWPLIQASRNHVKSYHDKYWYGFKQVLPDEDLAIFIKAVFCAARDLLDQFKPDLILTPNYAGFPHLIFSHLARQRGVPMVGVTDSKVFGIKRFSVGHMEEEGEFFDRLAELESGEESLNRAPADRYVEQMCARLIEPETQHAIRQRPKPTARARLLAEIGPYRRIYKYLRQGSINRLRNLPASIDDRPPYYILRDHYVDKVNRFRTDRFAYHQLPPAGSYVYFPLQTQPEATLDIRSVPFGNQIETARLVAMALPGDLTLVAKDHPTMFGKRPPSYLEKVARSPNVKLVDYRIPTEQVLRGARLLVSTSGTTLAEAAYMRIPAIQLGHLGTTAALPNVHCHQELTTIDQKIGELLSLDLGGEAYRRRLSNYVAAAYDTGFDFNLYGYWYRGEAVNLDEYWPIVKGELLRLLTKKMALAKAG